MLATCQDVPLYFSLVCKGVAEATISVKNQIVIPREAREALGVGAGDKVLIVVRGTRVIVLQKPERAHSALQGLTKRKYPDEYLDEERQSWD